MLAAGSGQPQLKEEGGKVRIGDDSGYVHATQWLIINYITRRKVCMSMADSVGFINSRSMTV